MKRISMLLVTVAGCAWFGMAETVTNNLNVQGGFIYNHGAINPADVGLTFTNTGIRDITVSAGQLCGVNPETGAVITNAANLLPLKAQSVTAVSNIVAGGSFVGNGSGLTNVNISSLSGSLSASSLPTSGVWNATGLTITNASIKTTNIIGNVAAMTNLTLGGIPLGQAVSNLQQQVAAVYTSKFSIMVLVTANESTNGLNLIAAYAQAKTMSPSATNRIAVIVPPGRYNLGAVGLQMDTSYIDLIGLTSDRSAQYLSGNPNWTNGVVKQSSDHVRIENVTLCNLTPYDGRDSFDAAAYFPAVAGSNTVIRNCEFTGSQQQMLSMRTDVEYAGFYEDVIAYNASFGGGYGIASGTFINCRAGGYSFSSRGEASGTFKNCRAGDESFGGGEGVSSGTFESCQAENSSFGGCASGTFTDCKAGNDSFGLYEASGTFTDCQAGGGSFGNMGASGTFTDCKAGGYSFCYYGTANGTFINCIGGDDSFGGFESTASGTFINCQAGYESFGSWGTLATNAVLVNCTAGEWSFGSFCMAAKNFNYNASGHIFVGGMTVYPQGDLPMGSYTNGFPQ